MKRINRFLGDTRALRLSLLNEINCETEGSLSVLDVGAGSGELLRTIEKWAKNTFLVGAELNEEAARSMKKNKILSVQCDALELPFADDSFDYAISSLFLHHLNDEQVVRLFVEMNRVTRKKFFVIDLHRHPAAYFLYKAFSPLFLQRFTQEDGALSILKSFQPDELKDLANRANLKNAEVKRRAAFRIVLSCEKKTEANGISLWKK
jgi:ubiquinone/menaquinone biosynthesis C-methylase UbiE